MGFVTSSAFHMLATAQRLNAQQSLLSASQQQMSLVNQVGQLAMTNPDALSDPNFTNNLFMQEKAMTLRNSQNSLNLKLYEQQAIASKKLLDKNIESFGSSLDLIG